MPRWAAIITGMAIITGITGITVTTADGVRAAAVGVLLPAAAVGPDRLARAACRVTEMRIPFYPRTF